MSKAKLNKTSRDLARHAATPRRSPTQYQCRPVEYAAPSMSEDFRVLGQKPVPSDDSPESTTSSHNVLKQMVSAPGHWSYNETSGRLRYFGATTDFDIYSGVSPGPHILDSREQERYGISVLKDVPPSVQDYLMDLYWKCFNSVIFVVHKEAFLDDQKRGHHGQYSAFLHITILAMGMRFADSSRPEISHLMLGSGGESRLQREARRLLEYELDTPGGVPSVQALLILGDMEFAVGRENTGWMYGMSVGTRSGPGLGLYYNRPTCENSKSATYGLVSLLGPFPWPVNDDQSVGPEDASTFTQLANDSSRHRELRGSDLLFAAGIVVFDDDFNTITIDGIDQARSTNRTVNVNPMDLFGDTRSIPALVTHSANDSLNKVDCGPPTQLLNGTPSVQWMSHPQQTSQYSRPRAPDWSSRYNDVPSYLG
ncbi:hypothetical protein PV11_03306 [Exophiala sideris]|uniref:Xylanolytic transcriptional activator regulatory domain-containing protein n=1 Tax=Exophiala sideris TaxID=1016849 RepID=A0A0D1Z1J6_9EURO|nr:hypothetical protein PV11_03306 [Exophiala sideris]